MKTSNCRFFNYMYLGYSCSYHFPLLWKVLNCSFIDTCKLTTSPFILWYFILRLVQTDSAVSTIAEENVFNLFMKHECAPSSKKTLIRTFGLPPYNKNKAFIVSVYDLYSPNIPGNKRNLRHRDHVSWRFKVPFSVYSYWSFFLWPWKE